MKPVLRAALILLGTTVAFAVANTTARAHSPRFNDTGSPSLSEAYVIDDLSTSLAIMGAIRESGAVDYYRIEAPAGQTLDFALFVPAACEGFYPLFVLIAPAISRDGASPGIEVPMGFGAQRFYVDPADWGVFFEPFDPSIYASGPAFSLDVDQGTYYLAVLDPSGARGAYMIGMGGSERWEPAEDWRDRKAEYDRCGMGESGTDSPGWRTILDLLLGLFIATGGVFTVRGQGRSGSASREHRFIQSSFIDINPQEVWDFHERPEALQQLTPPPMIVRLNEDNRRSLTEGTLDFTLWFGPIPIRWVALHEASPEPDSFRDTMLRGPMKAWVHDHSIQPSAHGTQLTDRVTYEYPRGWRGWLSRLLFNRLSLRFLFTYRHYKTRKGAINLRRGKS